MPARPVPLCAVNAGAAPAAAAANTDSDIAASVGPGLAPVLRAAPSDLAYVVALQKRNHEALGFIPRAALAEKIDLGRIWLATENGDPAGFLHHGSLAVPEVRIFQAAVQYDARRRHLGLALVADLVARARAAGAAGVSLRCLDFLDANDFWTAAGFRLVATEPGARGTLNVWGCLLGAGRRDKGTRGPGDEGTAPGADAASSSLVSVSPCRLVPASPSSFSFHSRIHPCPRCGAPTTDTWTRGAVRRRVCVRCVTLR
jgi:ribosomal protein S18 acetylase RimI-like enzyme